MKMQIKEFATLTGVSVRTLHYYDEIGLLSPALIDRSNGYRYYDDESLLCMQQILFYRELDFPLKSIQAILANPNYDKAAVLAEQRKLLLLKKERLERLILAIDSAAKGENIMKEFDNTQYESYKAEVREKWGKTDAYKEHSQKTKGYSKGKWNDLAADMDAILAQFAAAMGHGAAADSAEAQALVKQLQNHISENYYTCTNQILAGLGQMYVADERFRANMDKHAEGTAAFVSQAIAIYCAQN